MKPKTGSLSEPTHWDILLIDIVGYSTLLEEAQLNAIMRLTDAVEKSPAVARTLKSDLLLLPTGDGMVIGFRGMPGRPLELACQIHEAYGADRYRLKMGIHSGIAFEYDGINGKRNIAGSGINMAARVVSCCHGGHILVAAQPADSLVQTEQWGAMLHHKSRFLVKHKQILAAYNLYDSSRGIGFDKMPDRNLIFEPSYVSLVRTLGAMGVVPSEQISSRKILRVLGEPLAVGDVILEDSILGFAGVGPDQLTLSITEAPPHLPRYVTKLRDELPVPEFNRSKVFLANWDLPLTDAGTCLNMTLGRTDYRTLLAWEHPKVIERLYSEIEAGNPTLRNFQRRLTCHVIVITADRQIVLLRRSSAVHWEPGAWSVTLEESMAGDMDLRPPGPIGPVVTIRRALGKAEELGLPEDVVEGADIRFVALGIEWTNLAGVLCTVVRLPTTEAGKVRDYWYQAHDRGEHRAVDFIEFNLTNCLHLLRTGRHTPTNSPAEADRLHRTAKIRVLTAVFNEFGYGDVMTQFQEMSTATRTA